MPIVGELLADRYRIVALLGAGGMSSVYRALDVRLDREVALKVLLPNLAADPVFAERFEREARALAALNHPAVLAIYDVEPGDRTAGREPFYVMELCDGGSLDDRLSARGRLDPQELVATISAIGDGLAELHRLGIIHRDVKPHNILYAGDRAKLADFGIARQDAAPTSTTLTAPGAIAGTLGYLAPELLDGAPAGPASDTYALGAVAFQGMTGQLPRPTDSIVELVEGRLAPVPPASSLAPALGTAFDGPLASALALDPASRPAPDELGRRLEAALNEWRDAVPAAREEPGLSPPTIDPLAETLPAIPVPTMPPVRPLPGARSMHRTGRSVPRLVLLASLAVALGVLLGLGVLLAQPSDQAGLPSVPSVSQTPTIASSASTPNPAAAALAALDRVDAAINAARGGKDGLKGKEANDLEALAGDVRAALVRGDYVTAGTAANRLADRTIAVTKGIKDERAQQLRDAVATLVSLIPGV